MKKLAVALVALAFVAAPTAAYAPQTEAAYAPQVEQSGLIISVNCEVRLHLCLWKQEGIGDCIREFVGCKLLPF